jgi:hypothetical protein
VDRDLLVIADNAAPEQNLADGVIVGSRVVRAAADGGPAAVGRLVGELAGALGPISGVPAEATCGRCPNGTACSTCGVQSITPRRITSIPARAGGTGNDDLTGSGASNALDGGPGEDFFDGGEGPDACSTRGLERWRSVT